jgi:exosortase H (IPTLxxWG-CTERM-specific)
MQAISYSTPQTEPVGSSPVWLRFALICTLLLLAAIWLEPLMGPLNRATASLAGKLLVTAGFSAAVLGDSITVGTFPVKIITECTSLYPMLLFTSFVLAHPASWRRKVMGIVVAAVIITGANLARIAIMTVIGATRPKMFEILHVYLGQVVMLLLVVGCCLLWLYWDVKLPETFEFLFTAFCWSTILYTPWVYIHHAYLFAVDYMVKILFLIVRPGADLHFHDPKGINNHTFAIPFLVALIISTGSVDIRTKIKYGLVGLLILFAGHSLMRMTTVLWWAFEVHEIGPIFMTVYLISQFLLPVLIWRHLCTKSSQGTCAP